MERLILDYTVTGQHTLTLNNADAFSQFTKDNIRLIIDCTTQEPIVTPLDRTALDSVAYSSGTRKLTITLKSTSPVLTVGGELSVKIDDAVAIETSTLAKEATLGTANDTASSATIFGKIANLLSTWNSWISGAWATLVSNVTAIKAKTDNIGTPSDTSSASTLFGKVAAIPTTQPTDYAKQGSNPDINFTTLNAKMDTVIGTGITEITTQAITEIVNRVKEN